MLNTMSFATRLRNLRIDNDMSQAQLADKLNLKSSAVSKYEKGITQPPIGTLIQLSEIFSVTVDYLVGNSEVENPYTESQLSTHETTLLKNFRRLSYENKIRVDERIRTMLDARYKK